MKLGFDSRSVSFQDVATLELLTDEENLDDTVLSDKRLKPPVVLDTMELLGDGYPVLTVELLASLGRMSNLLLLRTRRLWRRIACGNESLCARACTTFIWSDSKTV